MLRRCIRGDIELQNTKSITTPGDHGQMPSAHVTILKHGSMILAEEPDDSHEEQTVTDNKKMLG